MKTISELNAKWWYRLLKVTFVIAYIATLLTILPEVNDELQPFSIIDTQNSTLTCLSGNNKTYKNYSSESYLTVETIKTLCGLDESTNAETVSSSTDSVDVKQKYRNEIIRYRDNDAMIRNQVSFNDAYLKVGSNLELILGLLGTFVGVTITFELIRRIFYYIVLGSIRPKKNHESDTILP
jgi:hypothetical protein